MDTAALIAKYDTRVPRYTSYPTAPHFSAAVDDRLYGAWLAALPDTAALSLYVHVPFCTRLCWYCGCHTSVVHHVAPVERYARALLAEIDLTAARVGRRLCVHHVAWGGGTPTVMPPEALVAVMQRLRQHFVFAADAEVAVEIDPCTVSEAVADGLAAMGCTRASLGVQDFDPRVQKAVNREQSFATTEATARALRARGIESINIDLMYGLPFQTAASVAATVEQTLRLAPDRVAVFGYAHVPWMKKHQTLLPEAELPGPLARYEQMAAAERVLLAHGWRAIGLDHYARPGDSLASAAAAGTLHRNFQGYTTDTAPVLLGFGASSIGSLPPGYAQNLTAVPLWQQRIDEGRLPTARGIALSAEDRLRREVIERLMCDGAVVLSQSLARHGADPATFAPAAPALAALAADGLVTFDGDHLAMRREARAFVRNVAAVFDTYLERGAARHARAI
jgi:oxygen-independent coproporphyrinogen-3 oxidase